MKKIILGLIFFVLSYGFGVFSYKNCYPPFCLDLKYKIYQSFKNTADSFDNNIEKQINLDTHLYNLDIFFIKLPFNDHYSAIREYDGKLYLMSQNGDFFYFDVTNNKFILINLPKFNNGFKNFQLHHAELNEPGNVQKFGIRDFYIYDNKLYVTSLIFDNQDKCISLGLYSFENFKLNHNEWKLLYKSHPCVSTYKGTLASWGGKLEYFNENIHFTIGDAFHDGVNNNDLTHEDTSYGKTFFLDSNNNVKKFTSGHRNPQGLLKVNSHLFSTEHGPVGGDELNLLAKNKHYGWPTNTYGINHKYHWPSNEESGFHDHNIKPIYSWIPSIGIGDIIQIDSPIHKWKDDLIISGMKDKSIYRVRLDDNVVKNVEKIEINERVRDMVYYNNLIYFVTDNSGLLGIIKTN